MKKYFVIIIFLIIIAAPLSLSFVSKLTGVKFDTNLAGYTIKASKPELNFSEYFDGLFQKKFDQWFEQKMALRGVFTKTYNTIRYVAFNIGNRPIGKDNYIFESNYLNAELTIGDYDFSIKENNENLQKFVDDLSILNEKLKTYGKYLYVYVAPNKADLYRSEISDKYLSLEKDGVNVVDCFRSKMEMTDIPYYICSDMADSLEYPAFYSTGIHWSRVYEQQMSQKIIDDLSSLSKNNYRNIILGDVESSSTPYLRDRDVYDLLNVWFYPELTYYQYETSTIEFNNNSEMNILLMGDSFASGLREDIIEYFPEDFVVYIDRNKTVAEENGEIYSLDCNWNNLKLQEYLDLCDFVVLEMTEPELVYYTFGFVEYVNNFLDSYKPCEKKAYYPSVLDASNSQLWNNITSKYVYARENGYGWIGPNCRINLTNNESSLNKLEIEYIVPSKIFEVSEGNEISVTILVNDKQVFKKEYSESLIDKTIIDLEDDVDNDVIAIDIICSDYFIPSEIGESQDNRVLSLQLIYIGGER